MTKSVRCLALALLCCGCVSSVAQQHWTLAHESHQRASEYQQRSLECAARQEWECAYYWQGMAQTEQSTAFSHQAVGDAEQAEVNQAIVQAGENFRQRRQEAVIQQRSFMQEQQLLQMQNELDALKRRPR